MGISCTTFTDWQTARSFAMRKHCDWSHENIDACHNQFWHMRCYTGAIAVMKGLCCEQAGCMQLGAWLYPCDEVSEVGLGVRVRGGSEGLAFVMRSLRWGWQSG